LTAPATLGYNRSPALPNDYREESEGELPVSDDNLIRQSYEEMIRTVFTQFYQASILAITAEEKAKAEQIFQTGVLFARQVRDRAVAILPA
jgi:hypothetical protein